ncbi:MAG: TrbC/VirB2 family protein [Acidobacteria bacterium]|nr:TrbC/VirB2 family protein [Acidobacteriota bacterium]
MSGAAECVAAAVWAARLCAPGAGSAVPAVLPRDRGGLRAGPAGGVALGRITAAVWYVSASAGFGDSEGDSMRKQAWVWSAAAAAVLMAQQNVLLAQGRSPWVQAVNNLQQAFTGPIARGLALVAIVVGGLMFAFQEGGSKQALAGIIFGLGMALGAANFITWLFR